MREPLTSTFVFRLGERGQWSGPADRAPAVHGVCHGCAIDACGDGAEKLMTSPLTCEAGRRVERVTRVELAFSAWEAEFCH